MTPGLDDLRRFALRQPAVASAVALSLTMGVGIVAGLAATLTGHYVPFAWVFSAVWTLTIGCCVAAASWAAVRARSVAAGASILGLMALVTVAWAFHHESIDVHTDPGAYWASAVFQARTGGILTTDPGFVRLPTFDYSPAHGVAAPQALPGYSIALGALVPILGIGGTALMNVSIFGAALVCVAGLMSALRSPRWAFPVFLLLFGSLYTTQWFSRRYGNEAISAVFLFGAAVVFVLAAERRNPALALLAPTFGLPVLIVRPEGPLYAATLVLAGGGLAAWLWVRGHPLRASSGGAVAATAVVLAACGALFLLFLQASGSDVFQENFIDPLARLFHMGGDAPANGGNRTITEQTEGWPGYERHQPRLVFDASVRYGLIVYYLAALAAVSWRTIPPTALWGLLGLAPAAFVFVSPGITPDQPWLMRRFWLIPVVVAIVLGSVWLARIGVVHRKAAIAVVALLATSNVVLGAPIYTFSQGHGASEQLEAGLRPFGGHYLLFSDALTDPQNDTKLREWLPAIALCCDVHVFPSVAGRANPEGVYEDYENFTAWLPPGATWHVVGRASPLGGEPFHPFFQNADLRRSATLSFNVTDLTDEANLFPYVLAGGNFSTYQPIADRMTKTPPTTRITRSYGGQVYDPQAGNGSAFVAAYREGFRDNGVRLAGAGTSGWGFDGRFRTHPTDGARSTIEPVANATRLTVRFVDERIETCQFYAMVDGHEVALARIAMSGSQLPRDVTLNLPEGAVRIRPCPNLVMVSATAV